MTEILEFFSTKPLKVGVCLTPHILIWTSHISIANCSYWLPFSIVWVHTIIFKQIKMSDVFS